MENGLKGYMAGRAVMGNVVGEMRRSRKDYQRRSAHQMKDEALSAAVAKFLLNDDADSAFEFLNDCFMDEVIDDAQHQKDRNYSLETILEKRKAKYLPYYERIGKSMPEKLAALTADELCETLGVENLHVKDSRGDVDKGRNPGFDIVHRVDLDAAIRGSEPCPLKDAKTQVYGGRVERIDVALKLEDVRTPRNEVNWEKTYLSLFICRVFRQK